MSPELLEGGMIIKICRKQYSELIRHILNLDATAARVDREVDERHLGFQTELDKVPDVVRCLRELSDNAPGFSSLKNEERILKLYKSSKGTPKYCGILSVIKNKVTEII